MKNALLTCFLICHCVIMVLGADDPCHKTTEGTDFWFGFMESRWFQGDNLHRTEITVTSLYDFTYSVYIGDVLFSNGTVPANTPETVVIPWRMVEAMGSETVEKKAIHLETDKPVNVYALNWSNASSDVALIYPKESLGNKYFTMCYKPTTSNADQTKYPGEFNSKNSEFLIVASENDTKIDITPTKTTSRGQTPNNVFSITLNKGDLYQVQSMILDGPEGDLTGSFIESKKPIAVFSGNYSTSIPYKVCCYDHLYEQIPPLQAWGRDFLTAPLKTRQYDYYRILAAYDNTNVRIGNILRPPMNKGEFYEFTLAEATLIQSDQPVLLAQYSMSRDNDTKLTGGDGDPFMIIVSPLDQVRDKVAFVAYNSALIKQKYFINVIVKDDAIGEIKLDGALRPSSDFKTVTGTGYSYAQINISNGPHTIESTDPSKGFTAYVYGFGGVESYGYGVGYNLDIVLDLGGEPDALGKKIIVRCEGNDPILLKANSVFDTYEWSTGETTPSVQVTEEGTYSLKASTKEGCVLNDEVKILLSKPVVNLGNDTTICNPETIVLDADPLGLFNSYNWTTPDGTLTDKKITVSKAGNYKVMATTTYGCTAEDEINISFADKPKLDLSRLDTLYCGTKTAILNISADKGDYTLERTDTGDEFQNLTAIVPEFGSFPFKFTATDSYGCASDSVFIMGFHKIPTVDFSIDSTTCYHYNLTARYLGDATIDASRFTWVFGGDTIADGIGIDSDTIPLGINQNKRDLMLKVTELGCSNADTIKDIKVIPNLTVEIVDSMGCQPFNAEFIAVNSETVTYDWDFGDGSELRLDDHPFHLYRDAGYYNLKLKVTTAEGCTNEFYSDSLVHVAPIPTAGFSPGQQECLSLGNHEVSYTGTGDQFDSYQWDLSAFDPVEIIQDPGITQGPFVFNLKNKPSAPVKLSVVSKYGCMSDTAKITVKRIPDFSMNVYDNKGCIPLETGFEGIINDPVDQLFFSWDYGDGTTGNGGYTTHFYHLADQKYNITLTAKSALTQCSDTLKIDTLVFVYPKPKANFSVDHSIVYNDKPDIQFLNQSSGAMHYSWDFGDGTTSIEENPLHKYQTMGYHNALLQAYNDFSCMDTISYKVLVAFAKIFPPNAFSPNAPNPVDREFKLGQEAVKQEGYYLVILNRWNDIVFETKNEIKGWNGRMKNGDYAPAGNYVWILNFTDFLGRPHRQTGTVTLLY